MQRSRRTTVGVLAGWQMYDSATTHSFLNSVLSGIRSAAQDQDCSLLLACGIGLAADPAHRHPAWPVPSPESDFVPVGHWNTEGLIVVNPMLSDARSRYVQDLVAGGYPVVFIGASEGGPAVGIDNEGGIRLAMMHLMAHGHRQIAYIAGRPGDVRGDSEERLRAYQTIARECDLAANPDLIAYGSHTEEGGRLAMQRILASRVSFTAVLASDDGSAFGAIQALESAGLRIPQDVAIVGFDDQPEAVIQEPSLTTIHAPTFERGYRALELLLRHIEGQKGSEIVKVPTRLIIRRSCGCQVTRGSQSLDNALTLSALPDDRAAFKSHLTQVLTESVLSGAQRLNSDEIQGLCQRLAAAFLQDLEQDEPSNFRLTLQEILWRVDAVDDNAHIWQAALAALRSNLAGLSEIHLSQAHIMIDQARMMISESIQQQYMKRIVNQRWAAGQMSLLMARLLAAADEPQVFDMLAQHLPEIGIRHIAVAFFEPNAEDPVAQCTLRPIPSQEGGGIRFPSRQFPPPGLYSGNEPLGLTLLPLRLQEEAVGFVVFDATDLELCGAITLQLGAALHGARLHQEALEGRRLAEEANRLKSRFLSTVSHELRTPLSLIVGLSRMLLQGEKEGKISAPSPYQQDLERVHASAQHLDGLIQDVLDLARYDVGQLKLVCEPLDLAEVLQIPAAVGEQMARDKGLSWQVEIPKTLPRVWGDRTRLRQVILNLITNAVKFTAQGGVALRVETGEGVVNISVSDTGLGIPVEELEWIFDEFRQSERTTARGYGGLGLGLAICKRLVDMHGGQIHVLSSGEEGDGSTFFFTLPAMEHPKSLGAPRSRRIALLLARHPNSSKRLAEHLTRQGFDVETLSIDGGVDWLVHLLSMPPDVVALDQELAAEQGWEILNVLRSNPATRDIPVMFYSLTAEHDGGAMLELDYLTKPMGTAELAQALKRYGLSTAEREGKTILIVDDEPGILEMHARVVQAQSAAYRVSKARDGREALAVIRQEHPDLVLLDLMMPELDGFGVLEAMQKEETIRNIPVIVLTAQTLTEKDMERLNRGVSAVLGKGLFSVEETLAHIEETLLHREKLGSEAQRLVRMAMAYIHEQYAEPISREEIARHVGVNKDHLSRCFHQEVGVTLTVYLNRYRVNQAKALLAERQKTITEVALAVGFSDSSYFSRVFRRETGMSPRAYRRAPARGQSP